MPLSSCRKRLTIPDKPLSVQRDTVEIISRDRGIKSGAKRTDFALIFGMSKELFTLSLSLLYNVTSCVPG